MAKFNEKRRFFRRENKKNLGIESEQLFGNSERFKRKAIETTQSYPILPNHYPITTQYSVPSKFTQEDLLRLLKNSGGVKTANGGVNRNCVAE